MSELAGILALDTSRKTGFAFARPGEPVESFGSKLMGPARGSYGELFLPFFCWLDARITEWKPRHVCYLAPIRTSFDNTVRLQRLYGLAAVINLVVERRRMTDMPDLEPHYTEDATMARFFTGKGRWGGREFKKRATIATCQRFGWDVGDDDDAADALGLLVYVENKLYPAAAVARGAAGPLFQGVA